MPELVHRQLANYTFEMQTMMTDPTLRFSSRVEAYERYRPSYPREILTLLESETGFTPASVFADIGSGTGILTGLFLDNGNRVFAVEPNREMREACERRFAGERNLTSVPGRAEDTLLESASVDYATAGQAFHWFDPPRARTEFRRILKPGGWAVLIWNQRRIHGSQFSKEYEQLLRNYGTGYDQVKHRHTDRNAISEFFGASGPREARFDNRQEFDFEGLQGRLLSCSYAPEVGHPKHEPMLAALRDLFEREQRDGRVSFDYDTCVYYGHLDSR